MNAEETRFADYLNMKYGKEFVVSDIKTDGDGFGVKGFRKGQGYPKDDKSFTFIVSYGGTGNSNTKTDYSDTYLMNLWSKNETTKIRSIMRSILGDESDYSVQIAMPHAVQDDVHGNIPTLEAMKAKHPNQISYQISVLQEGDYNTNKNEYLSKAYKVVEFLHSMQNLSIRMGYTVSAKLPMEDMSVRYACALTNDQLVMIKSSDELNLCFEKRGYK